uniref:NBS-LRR type resistance protein n=1 Tax=Cucumis melo TaxID=3656 RepID=A0A9I9EGV8_CUCME
MVVSHSLRIRYVIRCWVDDLATQKVLVGDPRPKPARRQDPQCKMTYEAR